METRKQVNAWYSVPDLSPAAAASDPRCKIGVVAPHYGLEHVSYLLDLKDYRHVERRRLPLWKLERNGTFWGATPVLSGPRTPLTHTFNMLPMNGGAFVSTFELELPFYLGPHREWQHRSGHRIMASDRCRALLSLSDTAADLARTKFEALGLPQVAAKIDTFRGGVLPSTFTGSRSYSQDGRPLRLIFVGGDGYRKGLIALLDAVEDARAGGIDAELTVISSLPEKTYALRNVRIPVEETHRRLRESPWIRYFPSLPYDEVRAEMAAHDLLAFPTLDETLGWVVVEAAMEGMGTISSNIFALPELVDDGVTGRIVDLPLNPNKRWAGIGTKNREEAWGEARATLRTGLAAAIAEAAGNRELVAAWGMAAKEKMLRLYHPEVAAEQLRKIYDRALQG